MIGRPIRKGAQSSASTDTGARESNEPAPPSASATATQQPDPSTELRRRFSTKGFANKKNRLQEMKCWERSKTRSGKFDSERSHV